MQHDFGDSAGEENAHGRMADRAVWERIDNTWCGAIDINPFLQRRTRKTRSVRDGGNVQQQIRRAAEGGVHRHGIANRSRGEDFADADSELIEIDQRPAGADGHGEPDRLS